MKKLLFVVLFFVMLNPCLKSQEKYGNALNLGVGLGYYGPSTFPAFHANYEFDVFKNFTLAPFITFQTRKDYYYGYDKVHGNYHNYYYRETYMPIGVKGSYYFDELFNAGDKWDFYAAGSLGFGIHTSRWIDQYDIDPVESSISAFYFALHAGAELHLSPKAGLFLDLSTGLSTFGVAFHL